MGVLILEIISRNIPGAISMNCSLNNVSSFVKAYCPKIGVCPKLVVHDVASQFQQAHGESTIRAWANFGVDLEPTCL